MLSLLCLPIEGVPRRGLAGYGLWHCDNFILENDNSVELGVFGIFKARSISAT